MTSLEASKPKCLMCGTPIARKWVAEYLEGDPWAGHWETADCKVCKLNRTDTEEWWDKDQAAQAELRQETGNEDQRVAVEVRTIREQGKLASNTSSLHGDTGQILLPFPR